MKLRIRGDSIRLRLTQSEVAELSEHGVVEERTHIPGGTFVYRLVRAEVQAAEAQVEGTLMTVSLPGAAALAWTTSDVVGMEATQIVDGHELKILVEKDFKCLAPRDDEDQSDAFAHPGSDTQSC